MRSFLLSFVLLALMPHADVAEKLGAEERGFLRSSRNLPGEGVVGEFLRDADAEEFWDADSVESEPQVDPHSARDLQVVNSTKSLGDRTYYFILISVAGSVPHSFTLNHWIQTHFRTNGTSFKTQLEACSMGKMRVISNGGMDVTVPGTLSNYTHFSMFVTEAMKIANARLGKDVNTMANHLAFCTPMSYDQRFVGVGQQNGNRINVHSRYCLSMSVLIHEFGHNFNLLHSGIGADPYTDYTCFMGAAAIESNGPKKCFNGYKSYQLLWYADRHLNLGTFTTPRKIQLAAFVDYRKTTANTHHVVVNVADLYFLQYNRAKDINVETFINKDQVTVVANNPGVTDLLAGLSPGNVRTAPHGGRTLYMAACRRIDAPAGSTTVPDVMEMTIGYDKNWCGLI